MCLTHHDVILCPSNYTSSPSGSTSFADCTAVVRTTNLLRAPVQHFAPIYRYSSSYRAIDQFVQKLDQSETSLGTLDSRQRTTPPHIQKPLRSQINIILLGQKGRALAADHFDRSQKFKAFLSRFDRFHVTFDTGCSIEHNSGGMSRSTPP